MNSNIGYAVDWLLVVFVNKRFDILPGTGGGCLPSHSL
jgi:hypothetical protein